MEEDHNGEYIRDRAWKAEKPCKSVIIDDERALPEMQKTIVSHPPTMYLIETVLESIGLVSTEQLSDIKRHRFRRRRRALLVASKLEDRKSLNHSRQVD